MHKGINTTCDEGQTLIAHTLRAEGFDAGEDGTGRGTPLVPVAFDLRNVTSPGNRSNPQDGDPCHTLHKAEDTVLAIPIQADAYRDGVSMGHDGSHANSGGQVAIAFESRFVRNGRGAPSDIVPPLKAQSGQSGKGDAAPLVAYNIHPTGGQGAALEATETHLSTAISPVTHGKTTDRGPRIVEARMCVRRITPTEAERLQGFPDGFTAIPYRGKPAADGPRYKALGNSMAVPCMAWIGQRIQMVKERTE